MAQDVIEIELEEAGYYGGSWFDEGGTYVVPDTWRMRQAIDADPEAQILNTHRAELPDGTYKDLKTRSLNTDNSTVTSPDGNGQIRAIGLNQDNQIQDLDNISPDGDLWWGTLLQDARPDSLIEDTTASVRLLLGRDVFMGVRKNNELDNGEQGGAAEFVKNPANTGNVLIENDYPAGRLIFECRRGGGLEFKTSNGGDVDFGGGDKIRRLFIEDAQSERSNIRFENNNIFKIDSNEVRLYGPQAPQGEAQLYVIPDPSSNNTNVTSPGTVTFNVGGYNSVFDLTGSRAKATNNFQFPVRSSAPSSPEPGDVVIADGTNWDPDGDGAAEKVIYNGSSWIEDTDLQTTL